VSRAGDRLGALVAVLTLVLLWLWLAIVWTILAGSGDLSMEIDFRVFWGAARLAQMGEPLAAFDLARLAEVHGGDPDAWLPWVYPPGLLLLLLPLGAADFFTAWVAFIAISLLAAILAMRLYAGSYRPGWIGLALVPAILPALVLGQVAVLWGAGVLAALAFLRDGRAVPAGVVLGLLTFKPQLGVLIAVALIASGQWRAMAVAALTAILFHGAATLVFGPGYWPALLDMAGQHAAIMRSDVAGAEFLVSPYSALVALGLPETLALALQWGLAAAALIAVALAWRTEGIGFDHKAALLVTAILIAPPYLWYGETALLAPALMLLIRAGLIRRTLPGAFLAILMALGVTPYLMAQLLIATEPVPMRLVAAPVLVVAFAVAARPVLARAIRRDGPT
jgi:hypothetical protein